MKIITIATALISTLSIQQCFAQDPLVNVYRWYDAINHVFVTIAEGECSDQQLIEQCMTDKTLLFSAYQDPGPDRIAVYGWYNKVSNTQISVAEDEFTDSQVRRNGYTGKHLQYYALTRGKPHTVCVYRWLMSQRHAWVTIPEDVDTDVYLKKGYHHKTYQYYAFYRKRV